MGVGLTPHGLMSLVWKLLGKLSTWRATFRLVLRFRIDSFFW
jgi:hypothetical protein